MPTAHQPIRNKFSLIEFSNRLSKLCTVDSLLLRIHYLPWVLCLNNLKTTHLSTIKSFPVCGLCIYDNQCAKGNFNKFIFSGGLEQNDCVVVLVILCCEAMVKKPATFETHSFTLGCLSNPCLFKRLSYVTYVNRSFLPIPTWITSDLLCVPVKKQYIHTRWNHVNGARTSTRVSY